MSLMGVAARHGFGRRIAIAGGVAAVVLIGVIAWTWFDAQRYPVDALAGAYPPVFKPRHFWTPDFTRIPTACRTDLSVFRAAHFPGGGGAAAGAFARVYDDCGRRSFTLGQPTGEAGCARRSLPSSLLDCGAAMAFGRAAFFGRAA